MTYLKSSVIQNYQYNGVGPLYNQLVEQIFNASTCAPSSLYKTNTDTFSTNCDHNQTSVIGTSYQPLNGNYFQIRFYWYNYILCYNIFHLSNTWRVYSIPHRLIILFAVWKSNMILIFSITSITLSFKLLDDI